MSGRRKQPANVPAAWALPPSVASQSQREPQPRTESQSSKSRLSTERARTTFNLSHDIEPGDTDRSATNATPSIAAGQPELKVYVCPLCWRAMESDAAAFRTHLRERHSGLGTGAFKGSKHRHACGFCCAVFESSTQWVDHVMQLTCTPDQRWLVANQILGILRDAFSKPITITVKSHHEFDCYMDGSKPNPEAAQPQDFKDILTRMEKEYSISTVLLSKVAALLERNQICLHQVRDPQYIVSPESSLCSQCTPANTQTGFAGRGLRPLTTPAPSEAAPKHSGLPPKHYQYTDIPPEQLSEGGALFVAIPRFGEERQRTYPGPVSGANIENEKKPWLHIRQEHFDYQYPCPHPDCEESYKDEETLDEHIRCHDASYQPKAPSRPLTCPVVDCKYYDTPFTNYRNLDIHLMNKHPDSGIVAGSKKPLTCPVFGCEYYNKGFSQGQAKKKHMERRHPGVDTESLEEEAASQRLREKQELEPGSVEEST